MELDNLSLSICSMMLNICGLVKPLMTASRRMAVFMPFDRSAIELAEIRQLEQIALTLQAVKTDEMRKGCI